MNPIYSASRFCSGNGNDGIFMDGGRDSIDISDDRRDCDGGIDDGVSVAMVVMLVMIGKTVIILVMMEEMMVLLLRWW